MYNRKSLYLVSVGASILNNKKAYSFLLIDSIGYSFIPVLAILSQSRIEWELYIFMSILLSVIFYTVYIKNFLNLKILDCFNSLNYYSILSGLCFVMAQGFLLMGSYYSDNNFLTAIFFQTYPIIIMMLFIKMKISKDKFSFDKIFSIGIAFLGIIILNYESGVFYFDYYSLYSLISAFLIAMYVSLVVKQSKQLDLNNSDILSNYFSRVFSLVFISPFFINYLYNNEEILINDIDIVIVLVNGLFCMSIGSIFYYKGIQLGKESIVIHLISYFSIIFSIVWIYLLDLDKLTPYILLGSFLIIIANFIINLKKSS